MIAGNLLINYYFFTNNFQKEIRNNKYITPMVNVINKKLIFFVLLSIKFRK